MIESVELHDFTIFEEFEWTGVSNGTVDSRDPWSYIFNVVVIQTEVYSDSGDRKLR